MQQRRGILIIGMLLAFALGCGFVEDILPEATETPPVEHQEEVSTEEPSTKEPTSEPSPPTPEPTDETPTSEPPVDATEESGASLEVINDTGAVMTELYISPVESAEWGRNWFDMPLEVGEARTIPDIAEGLYDIQIGNSESEIAETLYNVSLEGENTWTAVGTAAVSEDATLRFEEDFSDNRNNWGGVENEGVNYREPENGEYCIDVQVPQMTAWEWYEPFRTEEYFAEVKCTVDPMTDATCGLGFGPDGDNLIWYEVDAPLQSYALFLMQDDEWQDAPISWTDDQHISPDGENYLGLGQLGDTVYLYVNGILIDALQVETFESGRIGIGGASYEDGNITICLDDLRVWQID